METIHASRAYLHVTGGTKWIQSNTCAIPSKLPTRLSGAAEGEFIPANSLVLPFWLQVVLPVRYCLIRSEEAWIICKFLIPLSATQEASTVTIAPSAPPLRNTAPAASPAPAGTAVAVAPAPYRIDVNSVAAVIAESADPAALLIHMVLAVSAHSPTAPEQGALLSKVQASCAEMLKRVKETLLASVDSTPGVYNGFEIAPRAGSRSVDYNRLQDEYPDVYDECVRVGKASLLVRYNTD